MFPEFRDLITQLKTEDAHFARLKSVRRSKWKN